MHCPVLISGQGKATLEPIRITSVVGRDDARKMRLPLLPFSCRERDLPAESDRLLPGSHERCRPEIVRNVDDDVAARRRAKDFKRVQAACVTTEWPRQRYRRPSDANELPKVYTTAERTAITTAMLLAVACGLRIQAFSTYQCLLTPAGVVTIAPPEFAKSAVVVRQTARGPVSPPLLPCSSTRSGLRPSCRSSCPKEFHNPSLRLAAEAVYPQTSPYRPQAVAKAPNLLAREGFVTIAQGRGLLNQLLRR